MELNIPFSLKIIYLNLNNEHFEGKVEFHGKKYSIDIHAETNNKTIKVPFPVLGITDDEILVRISGPSGVYVQDRIKFNGQAEMVEIESNSIFFEVSNIQDKYDTIEIFVK